jgi:hypothetical protein
MALFFTLENFFSNYELVRLIRIRCLLGDGNERKFISGRVRVLIENTTRYQSLGFLLLLKLFHLLRMVEKWTENF